MLLKKISDKSSCEVEIEKNF